MILTIFVSRDCDFGYVKVFLNFVIMQYVNAMLRQHVGPICSSPKEKLAKYIRHTYSQMQITLIPVVSSS
jgi:hypothetical protein